MAEHRPITKVANEKIVPHGEDDHRAEQEHEHEHHVDPAEEVMSRNHALSPPLHWDGGPYGSSSVSQ